MFVGASAPTTGASAPVYTFLHTLLFTFSHSHNLSWFSITEGKLEFVHISILHPHSHCFYTASQKNGFARLMMSLDGWLNINQD